MSKIGILKVINQIMFNYLAFRNLSGEHRKEQSITNESPHMGFES
jgi:hypothetical protein